MRRPVQTVTGPIDADDLGVTLIHEHLLIDMYEPSLNSAGVLLDEALAVEELAPFVAAGGRSIVEQTTLGLHPDPDGLRRIALASGVQVIRGTGVYWHRFRPRWVDDLSEDQLCERFLAEVTEGSGPERIRAGLIGEVATGHREIDPVETRVLRAAARSAAITGVPIATHAIFTTIGLAQLDILEQAGADLSRVVIGHGDTCADPGYHRDVLARGAWLAFDTVGQTDKATDDWRADRIVDLAGEGHLDRLLISSDVCKRPALRRWGGPGYAQVLDDFLPRLTARGMGAAETMTLLVDNPRRVFS